MKTFKFLGILLLGIFFCLLGIDAFSSCDEKYQAVLTAEKQLASEQAWLDKYEADSFLSLWDTFWSERSDRDNFEEQMERWEKSQDYLDAERDIEQAKEAVAAAQEAYNQAYTAYTICMASHLTQEITGFCGHIYNRLDEDNHEWISFDCGHQGWECSVGIHYITYCYDCETLYYYCEGHTCSSGSGSGSDCQ